MNHRFRLLPALLGIVLLGAAATTARAQLVLNDTLRFIDIACGTTRCSQVVFSNPSAAPVTINSVGIPASPFSVDPTTPIVTPVTIPAGGTFTANFCYAPATGGRRDTFKLRVDYDGDNPATPDSVLLIGNSTAPGLVFVPPSFAFGNVTIGQQTCQNVVIRNDGTAPTSLNVLDALLTPFSPAALPNTTLQPGGEITVQICFTPTTIGNFFDTLRLDNGNCTPNGVLTVSGTGLNFTANVGPVLIITADTTDFDTTRCNTTKSRTITLRNVGTDPVTVTSVESTTPPFSGVVSPIPLVIGTNQERQFTYTYTPTNAPQRDTQVIDLVADNRVSLTIAAVIDVSASMTTKLANTTKSRDTAAVDAARAFLANLINDPGRGVIDEGAVYQFADRPDFRRRTDYTTNRTTLQNALPTPGQGDFTGNNTCIFIALDSVIDEIQLRNQPERRVIVLLTDGQDGGCGGDQNAIIARANAAGIRIYTIGIASSPGTIDSRLTNISNQTGGFFAFAPSADSLIRIYRNIANDLSRNQARSFTLIGRAVIPDIQITPATLDFDSVRVGANRQLTVTLTNVGDAPGTVTIAPPGGAFSAGTATQTIPPGQNVQVQMTFAPTALRLQNATGVFTYIACDTQRRTLPLQGVGYDSLVVELTGTFIGRPNSIVEIPVTLHEALPAAYDVRSINFTVSYNKTMLAPADPFVATTGTLTSGADNIVVANSFTDTMRQTTVAISGPAAFSSAAANAPVARLRFLVLLGDSLETPMIIDTATFADGNPKIGRVVPGIFQVDSLCYLPQRLLNAKPRINGQITKLAADPTGNAGSVEIEMLGDHAVRVELFAASGMRAGMVAEARLTKGLYTYQLPLDGLPGGVYLLRLLADGEEDVRIITITR